MKKQLSFTLAALLTGCSPAPTTQPEQVHIAFGDDPTTTLRIVWQTALPTAAPTVAYGTTPALGQQVAATRATYAYETGILSEATLAHLRPDTLYYYRVGDAMGGWSPVYSFRTAPRDPDSFTLTAFGDHGLGKDAERNVRNIIAEKPAFHLLLGDLSYANGDQPVWDRYLQQIEPMAATIPYMPTLGNHENEKRRDGVKRVPIGYVSYLARFALPGVETWYSFDYANVRCIAVNSDDYKNPQQLVWLERTLAEARQSKHLRWVIVYQHHPLFGSSKGREDNKGLIQKLLPLYDKYRVDLVLAGHDHHYERQYPVRGGSVTSWAKTGYPKEEGTLYITQGGGGKSLYDFSAALPEMTAYREKTAGYLTVTVPRRGPLTISAKRVDGTVMETITLLDTPRPPSRFGPGWEKNRGS